MALPHNKNAEETGCHGYLLIDVCYCVHPAANAHLVAHIGRVTELMDNTDVVGVGATK